MGGLKTDALIALLAQDAGPVPPRLAWRRLLPAVAGGALLALLLLARLRGLLPGAAFATAVPWLKFAYAAALAGTALPWLWRLARPGADQGRWPRAPVAVAAGVALAGVAACIAGPGPATEAVMGSTWRVCPCAVLLLSLPTLAGLLWALRGLAPTRPQLAGAAAGVVAGAVGAATYGFSCPEPSAAFVAVWYSAGVLAASALGALLGPRVLRW